jgi:hypothetical protein
MNRKLHSHTSRSPVDIIKNKPVEPPIDRTAKWLPTETKNQILGEIDRGTPGPRTGDVIYYNRNTCQPSLKNTRPI